MTTKEPRPEHRDTTGDIESPKDTASDVVPADTGTPEVELAPTKQETPASEDYQDRMTTTRSGAIWATTIFSLLVLILLIIFIFQNPQYTSLNYFAWSGTINVGVLVLASAVAGGIIVALAGAGRIIALKAQRRKQRKAAKR